MVPRGSDATGTDYRLEDPALQPHGREINVRGRDGTVPVQEYVSLISGLSMPEATSPNDKPPGSRVAYDSNSTFHKYQIAPLMSGVSSEKGSRDRDIFTSGTSSDQVV
ncbi:MAG: hypothetical protein ABEN55_14760, partial [Bradymonadaceae bacterium]